MIIKLLKRFLYQLGYVVYKLKPETYTVQVYGERVAILKKSQSFIKKIKSKYPQTSITPYKEGYKVTISSYSYYITSAEELFILKEIWVDDCYNFDSNRTCVVIDIGMNVGIASLHFASKNNVSKVYSYEPVTPTFKQGIINFDLNKTLKTKIDAFNFGLGIKNETLQLTFNPNYKGSVGKTEATSIIQDGQNNQTVTAEIRDIEPIFRTIISEHTNESLILKMDCEGAEFELIPKLDALGFLNRFDIIMMEYHNADSKILSDLFFKNGFSILKKVATDTLGMIYAFKTNNR